MRDDVVIVTYARHEMEEMPEVEEGMHDDLEEEKVMHDEEDPDKEKGGHDMDEDNDKEKENKFLTPQERAFLSALLS